MADEKPEVRVTEIGEFIRHRSCERRFKLETNGRRLARQLPFAERLFNTLDPVLQEAGSRREGEWEESLRSGGLLDLTRHSDRPDTDKSTPWETFRESLAALPLGQSAYGREIGVAAGLGALGLKGHIDFVLVLWDEGKARLRLVECKASRRDRTYHRIQVALYRMLVQELMQAEPIVFAGAALDPRDVECVVARIDEWTNESQSILSLQPLDLETEEADIKRLLADDGALLRIMRAPLSGLDYQLDEKCDGCVFNVYCLPESAREHRLELLGIEPSTARVLRGAGVSSIDDLANIDLAGVEAAQARAEPGFTESLELLRLRARTRAHTLPGGGADPEGHEVEPLPHTGHGQLPEHEIDGHRLVRVYLLVDYDYAENRIGALTAHVTTSDRQVHTDFIQEDGRWTPDPEVKERWEVGRDADGRPIYNIGPLRDQDKDIVEFVTSEWTGRYEIDTGTEKQLIQGFFQKLVDAIAEVAAAEHAPIHFYVWSRSEMTQLVEACSRVSSQLLGHLSQLLGCREALEQLIYSCLQDEVDRRYALGWTGRGLAVATSLRWFGRRYHWQRRVAGASVALDQTFTQDIFDFKTTLRLRADGTWADPDDARVPRQMFEIRSRFHDSLTAPYWRAYWRTLPNPMEVQARDRRLAASIRRYNEAAKPGYLRSYLRARAHALRWIEEGIRFKNPEIDKPLVTIAELPAFTLGVEDAAQASIDFLRLDHHVQVTDWVAAHLVPPINRVPLGRTIPVRDVESLGGGTLSAHIDLDGYDLHLDGLAARCTFGAGSMVRLSPCSPDPHHGQTIGQLLRGGVTCHVSAIDWATGEVDLGAIPGQSSRYRLSSWPAATPGPVFEAATIDESISDFVADRVDARLSAGVGTHAFRWFDPADPQVPGQDALDDQHLEGCRSLLQALTLPSGAQLAPDQAAACLDGLQARIQLLLGPPGTGKTATTATAAMLRILARRRPGDILLVAANTHLAVDTLLQRIDGIMDAFSEAASAVGLTMPTVRLLKAHTSVIGQSPGGRVHDFVAEGCARDINRDRQEAVLIIGGTTAALLKLARQLSIRRPWSILVDGFQVPVLIVDEASMMVFPHFLALATLVTADGEIMLAGDHRQLAPIVAHDWEHEDRPPAVAYQPFVSAYAAIQNIAQNPMVSSAAVLRSSLRFTFRLPPEIRELIARLYRRLDAIELAGLPHSGETQLDDEPQGGWRSVWAAQTGLFLVVHNERQSKQSNVTEAQIINQLLAAAGTQASGSIAIVTPHRAQRSLLTLRLGEEASVGVIDTVERLQGGERPTVIVSATVSDPAAIGARVEFILDLNRSNVAFSRAQQRLIVVCAEALLDYIPVEVEDYESSMLWKSLRSLCSRQLATERIDGHTVQIFTPPLLPIV